jgi:hypothetical protein
MRFEIGFGCNTKWLIWTRERSDAKRGSEEDREDERRRDLEKREQKIVTSIARHVNSFQSHSFHSEGEGRTFVVAVMEREERRRSSVRSNRQSSMRENNREKVHPFRPIDLNEYQFLL